MVDASIGSPAIVSSSKPEAIVFGIGCYSFEAPDADLLTMQNPEGAYSVHDWARDVEKLLRSMPSVDDIHVEGFRSVRGDHRYTWRETTAAALEDLPHTGLHRGGDLRPHPSIGRIRFSVTIPLHIQKEVFAYAEGRTGTRFAVDIRYGDGMPVAFVRSWADEEDPSLAVAIVRQFLKAESDRRKVDENPVRFVCMGPSPLWSQCAVSIPDANLSEDATVDVIDRPGYSWLVFRTKATAALTTVEDAYELVKSQTEEAIGVFYDVVSRNNVASYSREFIESELNDLVEAHRQSGAVSWFRRMTNGGRKANDLMLEILAVDMEQQRSLVAAEKAWAAVPDKLGVEALGAHFERESKKSSGDYISNVRAVVDLLNGRHSRDVEAVSVIVASLLGGVVGAAITAVVQLTAAASAAGGA